MLTVVFVNEKSKGKGFRFCARAFFNPTITFVITGVTRRYVTLFKYSCFELCEINKMRRDGIQNKVKVRKNENSNDGFFDLF